MMTPEEFQERIELVIDTFMARFERVNEDQERAVFREVFWLLERDLDLYSNGLIRPTGKNLQTINRVLKSLDKIIFSDSFITGLQNILNSYEELATANAEYFAALSIGFKMKPIFALLANSASSQVAGLVQKPAIEEAIKKPLEEMLIRFVTTSGDWLELAKELEVELVTSYTATGEPKALGYLRRFYSIRRLNRDNLFGFVRNYHQVVVEDAGLVWFRYTGGLVADSRDFCKKRVGRYFHKKEVESWAKLKWPEKRPNTNKKTIFTYLGGWNCRHSILPVSERMVPKSAISRAKRKGYID